MSFVKTPPRRTVLSFGSFDLSQPAHIAHLRDLSALGDELIIGCATDAFADLHEMDAITSYNQRREMLEHCRFVDRVIAQTTLGQIRTDIVNYNVCVFAMGAEWSGQFDDLQDIAQVIYLPRADTAVPLARHESLKAGAFRFAV